jgi:hypothetical protein
MEIMKKRKKGVVKPWKEKVLLIKRIGQNTRRTKVNGDGRRVNR